MPLPAGHPPFSSFSSFHGVRAAKPLFYWLECRFVIFAIFVKNPLYLAGQKHGLPKATVFGTPKKAHKKKSHKISEKPLDGQVSLGRKSLGHRPVDPCLSRRVSPGTPGRCAEDFSYFYVPFSFLKHHCQVALPIMSWDPRFPELQQ